MTTKFFSAAKTLILAVVISFGLSYVYAWTAPTIAPPDGNVAAPINTGSTAQTKVGNLNIGGNIVSSGVMQPLRLNLFGVGGNSGATPDYYGIYQESGLWTHPYPDLRIQYHTGIKYDAYSGYGGHQFFTGYNGSGNPAGRQMQITDKVYVDTDVCTTSGKCLSAAAASKPVLGDTASMVLPPNAAGYTVTVIGTYGTCGNYATSMYLDGAFVKTYNDVGGDQQGCDQNTIMARVNNVSAGTHTWSINSGVPSLVNFLWTAYPN